MPNVFMPLDQRSKGWDFQRAENNLNFEHNQIHISAEAPLTKVQDPLS